MYSHSYADAARITGFSRTFLYGEVKKGRLIARKAGRRTIITDSDLRSYIAALPPIVPAEVGKLT